MDPSSQYASRQYPFQSPRLPSPTGLGPSSYTNASGSSVSTLNDTYLASPRSPLMDGVQPSFLKNGGQLPSPTSPGAGPQSPTSPWMGSPLQAAGGNTPPSPQPKAEPDDGQRELSAKHEEEGSPVASDFVKKLYKMLEENTFGDIVCWGPRGDCFVIKELDQFTKLILPRMFKHSNFASFVRQLNKYDFHKVKNNDDSPFGDHTWVFRHPEFHTNGREALENIKRKVPGGRRSHRQDSSPSPPSSSSVHALQMQLERMGRQQDEMTAHIRGLENEYEAVLNEMIAFQRNLTQQDGLMRNLVQYCIQFENGGMPSA